jgi:hypothetical protein
VLVQSRIARFTRLTESTHEAQNKPFGRHFQGGSLCLRYPGLKPWAMMYNRFAVNPTDSQTEGLGCSVTPFRGGAPSRRQITSRGKWALPRRLPS